MTWTIFAENYSGCEMKTKFTYIFVEAAREQACKIFEKEFGFSPKRRTKSEIGDGEGYNARDYHIEETEDIVGYTQYHRRCDFDFKKNCFIERPQQEKNAAAMYKTFRRYVEDGGRDCEPVKFIKFSF